MARANAAIEDVRAIAWRDLARSITQPLNDSDGRARSGLRALASLPHSLFSLILFLALLAIAAVTPSAIRAFQRRSRLRRANSIFAPRFWRCASTRRSPPTPDQSPADLLRNRSRWRAPELQAGDVMLADADGRILASEPPARRALAPRLTRDSARPRR